MDLNNSQLVAGAMNNTGGVGMVNRAAQLNSKNATKQFMNTSFDASKSANTINYVNSAYMSAIPGGSGAPLGNSNQTIGVSSGAKMTKVGLK